jgi:hypothetical protein
LGHILYCHDGSITPIRRYCCFITHQELLWIRVPIIHGQLGWLVGLWPWDSLQFCCQRISIIKGKATMMKVVGGLLLRRRSSRQKHLRQDSTKVGVTRRYKPKMMRTKPKLRLKELRLGVMIKTKDDTDLKRKRLYSP